MATNIFISRVLKSPLCEFLAMRLICVQYSQSSPKISQRALKMLVLPANVYQKLQLTSYFTYEEDAGLKRARIYNTFLFIFILEGQNRTVGR